MHKIVVKLGLFLACLGCTLLYAVKTPEQELINAACENNVKKVKQYIEHEGVDVNAKCYMGGTTLYMGSAHLANVKKIKKEERKTAFSISNPDLDREKGSTALQCAAEVGARDVVHYLLTRPDIDLDAMLDGQTALHKAIIFRNYDIAQLLIKAGANYTKTSDSNTTVCDVVTRNRNNHGNQVGEQLLQLIDHIERYKSQLYAALEQNDGPQVRLLLQKVPYAIKDHNGNTLLHRAVRNCSPELVGLVLKLDTQAIALKNRQGQTPVHIAVQHNRFDLVELFTKLAHAEPESYSMCSIV